MTKNYTYSDFQSELKSIGLLLISGHKRKDTVTIVKKGMANPIIFLDTASDYFGTISLKSINASLYTENEIYTSIRLSDKFMDQSLEQKELPSYLVGDLSE